MIVLDASVGIELVRGTPHGIALAHRLLQDAVHHVPHLFDLEVAQALRRAVRAGRLSPKGGANALRALAALPLQRHPHLRLLDRVWELRDNVTAYDASYVVLAEALLGAGDPADEIVAAARASLRRRACARRSRWCERRG